MGLRTVVGRGQIRNRGNVTTTFRVRMPVAILDLDDINVAFDQPSQLVVLGPGEESAPLELRSTHDVSSGMSVETRVVLDRVSPSPASELASTGVASATFTEVGLPAGVRVLWHGVVSPASNWMCALEAGGYFSAPVIPPRRVSISNFELAVTVPVEMASVRPRLLYLIDVPSEVYKRTASNELVTGATAFPGIWMDYTGVWIPAGTDTEPGRIIPLTEDTQVALGRFILIHDAWPNASFSVPNSGPRPAAPGSRVRLPGGTSDQFIDLGGGTVEVRFP